MIDKNIQPAKENDLLRSLSSLKKHIEISSFPESMIDVWKSSNGIYHDNFVYFSTDEISERNEVF